MTHYVPFFCEPHGQLRAAACGRWVNSVDHAAEPSCLECVAWLEAEATPQLALPIEPPIPEAWKPFAKEPG